MLGLHFIQETLGSQISTLYAICTGKNQDKNTGPKHAAGPKLVTKMPPLTTAYTITKLFLHKYVYSFKRTYYISDLISFLNPYCKVIQYYFC